ncbi:hypothetical protein BSKO_06665 [Bryopsis sp. KO-2023]|nr:hypothetical protein BSKO_06665 [Bryopsis sp. KO-2023]
MEEVGPGKRVYVCNLPRECTVDEVERWLQTNLSECGEIKEIKVVKRNRPEGSQCQNHEGQAHVVFETLQAAEKAVTSSKNMILKERIIRFRYAKVQPLKNLKKEIPAKDRMLKTEARQRNRHRRMEREAEDIIEIISRLPEPGGCSAEKRTISLDAWAQMEVNPIINWEKMPVSCDPCDILQSGSQEKTLRGERKRWQVESFALLLDRLLGSSKKSFRIVDIGCGTGNLALPLAVRFPLHEFTALDMKPQALNILNRRSHEAGLTNIKTKLGMVEDMQDGFDVCLALHACGNATDYAMMKAVQMRAAYLVSPCCVGKLKFSLTGGSSFHMSKCRYSATEQAHQSDYINLESLSESIKEISMESDPQVVTHPRSAWMTDQLTEPVQQFQAMAKMGDYFHSKDSKHGEASNLWNAASLCKLHIEIDRNQAAKEAGYMVELIKTIHCDQMAKKDLLMGVPPERSDWSSWDSIFRTAV